MGLLDDAIKDHLELKRRHGADPGEVARLEHEALGPARREPAATAAAPPPPAEELVEFEEFEEDEDEVVASERLDAPVHDDEPSDHIPEYHPEPPASSVDQPTRQFSIEELEDATQSPPAPPRRAEPEPEDRERRRDEPQQPPHEDVVPADDEPEGEDVLEETPEFLQETPEHDRLWFEQKPPKDFDF
jgi:hypothetical protein